LTAQSRDSWLTTLAAISEPDLAWLAGLLEGEGSFLTARDSRTGREYRYPRISVGMTDRDVIERAAWLLGERRAYPLPAEKQDRGKKPQFRASLSGWAAAEVMRRLRPWMGKRRGADIDQILSWSGSLTLRRRRPAGQQYDNAPDCLPTGLDAELAWLAGLLEGEGSFLTISNHVGGKVYRYPKIVISMTDRDVIGHAARLLNGNDVYPLPPDKRGRSKLPAFRAGVSGKEAAGLMRAMRPWMGERRGAAIDAILAEYDAQEPTQARRRRSNSEAAKRRTRRADGTFEPIAK